MEEQIRTFKRWEDLDITDDFIFTRVMRNKRLRLNPSRKRPQGRFPENSTIGVLRGRRGFAGAQPRLAKVAVPLATFRPKGRRSLPKQCWGSRSKHAVRSFQRRGGFRRSKRQDIAASWPLLSRGGFPS